MHIDANKIPEEPDDVEISCRWVIGNFKDTGSLWYISCYLIIMKI